MRRLKSLGKSYRYIATWLEKNEGVEMTFMGVRSIILAHKRL